MAEQQIYEGPENGRSGLGIAPGGGGERMPYDPMLNEYIKQEEKDSLQAFTEMINIADTLSQETLAKIGFKVCEEFTLDKNSRSEWEEKIRVALDMAQQDNKQPRTWAGQIVSNVIYPAISTSAIAFAARAYPNIVQGTNVVKCKTQGLDPTGEKQQRADRIAQHMSYQILNQMPSWEEDMDQLLTSLPVMGVLFKKTYYDPVLGTNRSELVNPIDLVVNNSVRSLEEAERITHVIPLSPRKIEERKRARIFLDVELGQPVSDMQDSPADNQDDEAEHIFLEQHRFWDLDGDGYQEPYIVTVHKDTQKVVRISARFDADGISVDEKDEIIRIEPVHYFTKFPFMPTFDCGFYSMGFGILLLPLNDTINTTINQLLDAGTIANRQGGFMSRSVADMTSDRFIDLGMGEWKPIDFNGDDIRKVLFVVPNTGPSVVLFQLLNLMLEASEKLSSTADILTGQEQGSNVPATTVLAQIEQGLKVFSAIYKRIHRALKSEFRKIRRLNRIYLSEHDYMMVLDDPRGASIKDYFDKDMDVAPVSDASDLTDMQRILKAKTLLELRGTGLNDREVLRRYLEALQIEDVESMLPPEGAEEKIPPEIQLEMQRVEVERQRVALEERKIAAMELKTNEEMRKLRAESIKALADAEAKEKETQIQAYDTMARNQNADNKGSPRRVESTSGNKGVSREDKGSEGAA